MTIDNKKSLFVFIIKTDNKLYKYDYNNDKFQVYLYTQH